VEPVLAAGHRRRLSVERRGVRKPASYAALARLGRVRLSRHFYMRNFLNSEIGNFYGMPNLPDDPDLAVAAGRRLCTELLEPLVETFGPVEIRSGYRSPSVNGFGNARGHECAQTEADLAGHVWDRRDAMGRMGAMVSLVIPWFADRYNAGRDWRDLAWWLFDHLPPHYAQFFPKNAAFNLGWREAAVARIDSYIAPRGALYRAGDRPDPDRAACYADFPPYRGLCYPD